MKCPVDGQIMLAVTYDDIEVDFCPECQGIWLDSGELELLIGDAQLLTFSPARAEISEKRRRCPICSVRMNKQSIGNAGAGARECQTQLLLEKWSPPVFFGTATTETPTILYRKDCQASE